MKFGNKTPDIKEVRREREPVKLSRLSGKETDGLIVSLERNSRSEYLISLSGENINNEKSMHFKNYFSTESLTL